ncbi:carbon monoxide dehydrogenase subunit G [Skermanella stibiiresistens SB22]|uniref:Carbon monoxide dehydrogenase subunit G n=1 Tax=Skermanella stibiiresistens SB22 TaxID=1385369 RepID=W9H6K8_9PROT|nr:carbon monoxide dehydrogenase subunit G [Skermanella stibiiresistens]EWY41870.1 carbon monoxide dehydrogenase subunit G [Skermanella stibiiresistens SB22]
MDMTGEYKISAPRSRVWEALNDPEILRQCIPGCEEIQKQSDTEMTAKVTAKVGPVKAKFAGKVTLSDIDPPNGYTISGEGSGGAAGFGKGGAKVALLDDGPDTILNYTAHAQVGGKLAQIGSRLIDGTARKMADDFFAKFTEVVGRPPEAAVTTAEAVSAETTPIIESPASSTSPPVEDTLTQPVAAMTTETAAVPPPSATRAPPPPTPAASETSGGLQPIVWIPLVVVVVGILLWAFI